MYCIWTGLWTCAHPPKVHIVWFLHGHVFISLCACWVGFIVFSQRFSAVAYTSLRLVWWATQKTLILMNDSFFTTLRNTKSIDSKAAVRISGDTFSTIFSRELVHLYIWKIPAKTNNFNRSGLRSVARFLSTLWQIWYSTSGTRPDLFYNKQFVWDIFHLRTGNIGWFHCCNNCIHEVLSSRDQSDSILQL